VSQPEIVFVQYLKAWSRVKLLLLRECFIFWGYNHGLNRSVKSYIWHLWRRRIIDSVVKRNCCEAGAGCTPVNTDATRGHVDSSSKCLAVATRKNHIASSIIIFTITYSSRCSRPVSLLASSHSRPPAAAAALLCHSQMTPTCASSPLTNLTIFDRHRPGLSVTSPK